MQFSYKTGCILLQYVPGSSADHASHPPHHPIVDDNNIVAVVDRKRLEKFLWKALHTKQNQKVERGDGWSLNFEGKIDRVGVCLRLNHLGVAVLTLAYTHQKYLQYI